MNMKAKRTQANLIFLSLVLLMLCDLFFFGLSLTAEEKAGAPRGKITTIGSCRWFTEQNTMDEMKAIAIKEKKAIFAVFSATWCVPCQVVKKDVFMKPAFARLMSSIVPFYIEQTDPRGKEYCRQFQIRAFPTFILLSETGEIIDRSSPEKSIEGFQRWITKAKSGFSLAALEARLKTDPNDREALVKIVDRMDVWQLDAKIENLKKAIAAKPDTSDPLSQEAYEKLSIDIFRKTRFFQGQEKVSAYLKAQRTLFDTVRRAYWPNKLCFDLAKNPVFLIEIYSLLEEKDVCMSLFEEWAAWKAGIVSPQSDCGMIAKGVDLYLNANKPEQAQKWAKPILDYLQADLGRLAEKNMAYYYSNILCSFIRHAEDQKHGDEAKKYLTQLLTGLSTLPPIDTYPYDFDLIYSLIKESSPLFPQLEAYILKRLQKGESQTVPALATTLAKARSKRGNLKGAEKILVETSMRKELYEGCTRDIKASIFNMLANSFIELGILDKGDQSIAMAKSAVELVRIPAYLDTLARLCAMRQRYAEAIAVEEEAVKLEQDRESQENYRKLIQEWTAKKNRGI